MYTHPHAHTCTYMHTQQPQHTLQPHADGNSDGLNGTVCARTGNCAASTLSSLSQTPGQSAEEKHANMVAALKANRYVYFMMGDSHSTAQHATAMTCGCTPENVAIFLLILEEGCILGCNGRSDSPQHPVPPLAWWSNHLGNPVGPPVTSADNVVTRVFTSGTTVTYNMNTNESAIVWGT